MFNRKPGVSPDSNKLGHSDEDVLIKRLSTELQAFVDIDPELEAKVMEKVSHAEDDLPEDRDPEAV